MSVVKIIVKKILANFLWTWCIIVACEKAHVEYVVWWTKCFMTVIRSLLFAINKKPMKPNAVRDA